MLTSQQLAEAINACSSQDQNVDESWELAGIVQISRKLSGCNTAEITAARECLLALVDSAFAARP